MARTIFTFLIVLIFAIVANIIWLVEIVQGIGWAGTSWIRHEHSSIFIINLLTILSYELPFFIKTSPKRPWIALLLLYFSGLIFFYISKGILVSLAGFSFFFLPRQTLLIFLLILFAIPITAAFSIHRLSNQLLMPIQRKAIFVLLIAMIAPIFLGMLTINFFPGYGYQKGFADAIKMGYPFFWVIVSMGIAGMLISSRFQVQSALNHTTPDYDDILDAS